MTEFNEVETTLYIQDQEYQCTFSFDYETSVPAAPGSPGCAESASITSIVIETKTGLVVDMLTPEYDWLLISELHESLEEDALAHVKVQLEDQQADRAA